MSNLPVKPAVRTQTGTLAQTSALLHAIDGVISRVVRDLVTPGPAPGQELPVAMRNFSDVRQRTLEFACNMTSAQAGFQPAPGAWCIAEVLDHLLLTEQAYRSQLQRLIELARAGKATSLSISMKEMNPSVGPIPRDVMPLFETPLRMMNPFIPHAFREAMIRFPLIAAINPSNTDPARRDIALLRAELISSLDATKAIFEQDIPARLSEMTVSHPVLGNNNVVEIFSLMTAHEQRHHGQIRTILANPRLPAG